MLILEVASDVLFGYFRIPRLRPKLTIARNLLFSAIDNLGTENTDTVFLDISVHVPLESWSYSGQSFTLSVEFEIVWSTRGVSQTALQLQPEARSDIATGVWSGSQSDVEGRPCLASNAGAARSSVIEQTPASTVSPPSTIVRTMHMVLDHFLDSSSAGSVTLSSLKQQIFHSLIPLVLYFRIFSPLLQSQQRPLAALVYRLHRLTPSLEILGTLTRSMTLGRH